MKKEIGTVNVVDIKEALREIDMLTKQYKRKRMTTSSYIQRVHQNLAKLTSERNYDEYLKNLGH